MTSDLRELYQETLLDHYKTPRNWGRVDPHSHEAEGANPLCGDRINIYLQVENNSISDISFEGSGCAISTASASLMTEALKGKTLAEAEAIFEGFHALLTEENTSRKPEALGKLVVFEGVREFPLRVKCASLAWHTMRAALAGKTGLISTES